jgi:hypothetical protein
MDHDSGSSVTLIYYRIGEKWWKEPFLNVVAAAAQMSSLTHVEIALGEEVGTNGMMTNVCRVFNDKARAARFFALRVFLRAFAPTHCTLVYRRLVSSLWSAPAAARTTSTRASAAPRRLSTACCATPRCSAWASPFQTRAWRARCCGRGRRTAPAFFAQVLPPACRANARICSLRPLCLRAELVAAILKEGGLLEASSNPGSATPETLHKIYLSRAAVTANPYVLRDLNATTGLTFCNTMGAAVSQCHQRSSGASASTTIGGITAQERAAERETLLQHRSIMAPVPPPHRPVTTASALGERRHGDSPLRGHFRVITHVGSGRVGASSRDATAGAAASMCMSRGGGSSGQTARAVRAAEAASANTGTSGSRTGMQLTMNSLDMRSPNLMG